MDRLFISNIEDNEVYYMCEKRGISVENVMLMHALKGCEELNMYWQEDMYDR